MKTICHRIIILVVGALTSCSAKAQGTFQNLNFESPISPLNSIYPPDTAPAVLFSNAFPGWVGYVGTNQAAVARIDGVNLDEATHAIIRSNIVMNTFVPLIDGSYTAVLQPGRDPNDQFQLVSVALTQTGLVPADSLSLRFLAYTVGTSFAVALGGVNIPIVDLETFPNYHVYGGDISAFAGTIAELRFTAFSDTHPGSTVFALDSIQFSNQPIPEPNVFALFALGALLLGWQFLKRKS